MKINIVSKQLIKPSSPTPSHLKDYKLSFIDESIPHSYIPLIVYYSITKSSNFKQNETSERLKKSLAETLTQFYPMAGRINGQTSIDCNDEGVYYSEAEVEGRLADVIECPEIEVLDQFIPFKSTGTISNAQELLAIQVNLFSCGGFAIGMCHSHRIGDGCTICTFVRCWAAKACDGSNFCSMQLFKSASLFPPRGTPDFRPNPKSRVLQPPVEKLVTRRFIFTPEEVDLLKTKAMNHSTKRPTRVQVVSALIWKCWMTSQGLDTSVAIQAVNLRGKIIASLPEYSFGNIFQMAFTVSNGDADWISLVEKLRIAIQKIDQEYGKKLAGEKGFEVAKSNFDDVRKLCKGDVHVIRFSSWCGFPFSKADFGWGNPVWVSSTSFSCKNQVFLLDSTSPGGIEAWIAMADNETTKFEQALSYQLISPNLG